MTRLPGGVSRWPQEVKKETKETQRRWTASLPSLLIYLSPKTKRKQLRVKNVRKLEPKPKLPNLRQ